MSQRTADGEFLRAMTGAARAVKSELDRVLQDHGIYAGQQLILESLWERDGRTPGELAELCGVALPTITRGLQRMEARGFLTRGPDPVDARSVRVRLTGRGRRLQTTLPPLVSGVAESALAGLSPSERRDVINALSRIAGNLPRA